MLLNKSFRILLLITISFMLLSCSSSRKVKKKCLDCPKFSQVENMLNPALNLNAKI